ncbi:hypothetical protein ABK040_008991 [Willaertia magna]
MQLDTPTTMSGNNSNYLILKTGNISKESASYDSNQQLFDSFISTNKSKKVWIKPEPDIFAEVLNFIENQQEPSTNNIATDTTTDKTTVSEEEEEKTTLTIQLYINTNHLEEASQIINMAIFQVLLELNRKTIDVVILKIDDYTNVQKYWTALENLQKYKIIKNIGLCNPTLTDLEDLQKEEIHTKLIQLDILNNYHNNIQQLNDLINYCKDNEIKMISGSFIYKPNLNLIVKNNELKEVDLKYVIKYSSYFCKTGILDNTGFIVKVGANKL